MYHKKNINQIEASCFLNTFEKGSGCCYYSFQIYCYSSWFFDPDWAI